MNSSETASTTSALVDELTLSATPSATSLQPVQETVTVKPAVSNATNLQPDLPLLEDIWSKMSALTGRTFWTDDDRQIIEAQIDAILWQDIASDITINEKSPAHQLWDRVLASGDGLLRWEFMRALRSLSSAEAIALEKHVIDAMLLSASAGDRIAAIESFWHRDPRQAKKRFKKLLPSESNTTIAASMSRYLGTRIDGAAFSSAA